MLDDENIALSADAARVYEAEFVPAIFAQWAPILAGSAAIGPSDRVLDAGCGTGAFTRYAASVVGKHGSVTGVDVNESMLDIARDLPVDVDWQSGDITALPFPNESFNVVVSQFVLMFVPDQLAALKEMWRVLAPGGRLVLSAWSDSPVYMSLAKSARRNGANLVAGSFESFFNLSDKELISGLFAEAGMPAPAIETVDGTARFDSVGDFVRIEITGWVLSDALDDATYGALRAEAHKLLKEHSGPDDEVEFPLNAHVASARKE